MLLFLPLPKNFFLFINSGYWKTVHSQKTQVLEQILGYFSSCELVVSSFGIGLFTRFAHLGFLCFGLVCLVLGTITLCQEDMFSGLPSLLGRMYHFQVSGWNLYTSAGWTWK
jgi:hypothetical protein